MNAGTLRALWLTALIVLTGACVALSRQLATERDRTQLETERITQLQARLDSFQSSEGKPAAAAEKRTAVTASAATVPARMPAAAGTTAQATARVDPNVEISQRQKALEKASDQMYADPESRKLALSEMKTNLRQEFPDVGRQLHLSAQEEDEFRTLLAEQRMRLWERSSKERASGQSPMFSQERLDEDQRTQEAEITALLGTRRAEQFKEYQQSLPERRRVAAFQATLDEKNTLDTENAERLITKLADQRRTLQEEHKAAEAGLPSSKMTMAFANGMFLTLDQDADPAAATAAAAAQMESYDRKMAEVAAPVLTTAQLKAFTTFQSQRRESLIANVRMQMLNMEERKKAWAAKSAQPAAQQTPQ
jgi:hypothetical protein